MLKAKNVRYILSHKNRVILTSVVLSQYTRLTDDDDDRQTDNML